MYDPSDKPMEHSTFLIGGESANIENEDNHVSVCDDNLFSPNDEDDEEGIASKLPPSLSADREGNNISVDYSPSGWNAAIMTPNAGRHVSDEPKVKIKLMKITMRNHSNPKTITMMSVTDDGNTIDEDCPPPETKKARLSGEVLVNRDDDGDNRGGMDAESPSSRTRTSIRRNETETETEIEIETELLPTTRWLLSLSSQNTDGHGNDCLAARLPTGLVPSDEQKKIRQDVNKLRALLNRYGLRTSKISSPREAVSIYKDSCKTETETKTKTNTTASANSNSKDPGDGSSKDGTEFLLVAFGLHPRQQELEKYYQACIKNAYCLLLFCKKLKQEYGAGCEKAANLRITSEIPGSDERLQLQLLVREIETTTSRRFGETSAFTEGTTTTTTAATPTKDNCATSAVSSRYAREQVAALIELACASTTGKRRYRAEEWKKEYQRIRVSNSTISNAYLVLLQSTHELCIKEIFFKHNPKEPNYERITIYLYDPEIDYRKPNTFLFLPGLHTILTKGPHELVSTMIESFWSHVLRNGYFPTTAVQRVLESRLRSFFVSGLVTATATPRGGGSSSSNNNNSCVSLPLQANFVPSSPLSIYLHGKAGAGKSSFAKVVPMALQATLEQHLDPECTARFVKQNLNKPMETLELEFQLRPNNNDMSVMSIIQGRRMSMSQSKPGIVVLNLEEMPMHFHSSSESESDATTNPNQEAVARLISQRFGGRKGDYQQQQQQQQQQNSRGPNRNCRMRNGSGIRNNNPVPRNSDKRSIGRDHSLVTIFTSNYPIAENSRQALAQLELYETLTSIEMTSITGSDREQFARSFLRQCLVDRLGDENFDCAAAGISMMLRSNTIVLDIESVSGNGDTRALVRQLRMFSFYLGKSVGNELLRKGGRALAVEEIGISQTNRACTLTVQTSLDGTTRRKKHQRLVMGSLTNWYPVDPPTSDSKLQSVIDKVKSLVEDGKAIELGVILEFWVSMTLAPVVILSRERNKIEHLMNAIECLGDGVHCIRSIDAERYKMIRSLYDPKEMPNLRDDILKLGRGALVATELICHTQTSQLCIREMIEDSPSMTAFSSAKSALYKSGLLFAIYVEGEVTPEVLSRVSFVL